MSAYLSVDVMQCLAAGHYFTIAGSDKTPLKRNLICETCTNQTPGKTAYAAYGEEAKSFGEWRTMARKNE